MRVDVVLRYVGVVMIFIALFMIMRGATLLVFGWNAGRMLL